MSDELLRADFASLRDAVAIHRAELLHDHLRWGSGPDHPEDECEEPDECSHLPQITSADRRLWEAAGLDPKPRWHDDHPVERLLGHVAHLQAELDKARGRS